MNCALEPAMVAQTAAAPDLTDPPVAAADYFKPNGRRSMSENGEAFTPKEEAQIKAELTVRDAWLSVTEACNMFSDPIARPFIEQQAADIRSMQTKLTLLASAIEVSNA